MKQSYEQAELEIIMLETADVITASDNEGPGMPDD